MSGAVYTAVAKMEMLQTYSVAVDLNWRTAPSGKIWFVGELTISFSCDPGSSPRLVDMALTEFDQLQVLYPISCSAYDLHDSMD